MIRGFKAAFLGGVIVMLSGCYLGSSAYVGIGIGSVGLVTGWNSGIGIGYISYDGAETVASRSSSRVSYVQKRYAVSRAVARRIVGTVQAFAAKDFSQLEAYGLDDSTLTASLSANGSAAMIPFLRAHLGVSKSEARRILTMLLDDAQGQSI